MKNVIIYHNPRCSKSREALQILQKRDIEPIIIEYLKIPLTAKEITRLLKLLAISPQEIMRKNEKIYQELNLDSSDLTDKDLIQALAEHPILLERPIVIVNQNAVIARPPERLLELI